MKSMLVFLMRRILFVSMLLCFFNVNAQWTAKIDSTYGRGYYATSIVRGTFTGNKILILGEFVITSDDLFNTLTYRSFEGINSLVTDIEFLNPNEAFLTLRGNTTIVSPDSMGIYKTLDGGVTWSRVPTNFIGFNNEYGQIMFRGNTGYAWNASSDKYAKTTDGGNTWTMHNPGLNGSIMHFFNADTGFITQGSFNDYYTRNGGQNWTIASPEIPINSGVRQYNDSCAFSASSNKVFHTADYGLTWQQVNSVGTMSGSVYDIYVVQAIDSDTLLAANYYGGDKLFVSINGGEHFQRIFIPNLVSSKYTDQNVTGFFRLDNGTWVVTAMLKLAVPQFNDVVNQTIFSTPSIAPMLRSNDVSVEYIDLANSNTAVSCPGDYTIYVEFKNQGWDTLRSVDFTLEANNAVIGTYNWQGALPPGSFVKDFPLGLVNMPNHSSVDVKITSSNPNGVVDEYVGDDTLRKTFTINRVAGGTYTVGGTNPDFATLNAVFDSISAYRLCGPIVLNLRPGRYGINHNITSTNILADADPVTITIQSENGVAEDVVIGDSLAGTFNLANAPAMVFKNLTFGTDNSVQTFATDILAGDTVKSLIFEGCVFINAPYRGISASQAMLKFSRIKELRISDCKFYNNNSDAIKVSSGSKVFINGSEFYSNSIDISGISDTFEFVGNKMYGDALDALLGNVSVAIVENNFLKGDKAKLNIVGPGISNTNNSLRFVNNVLITTAFVSSNTNSFRVYGFYQPFVAHNTLLATSNHVLNLGVFNCNGPIIKNNIIVVDTAYTGILQVQGSTNISADNNVYFTPISQFESTAGGRTWSQWRALGYDANSVWLKANLDANSGHLLPLMVNSPIFNAGANLGVASDLTGKPRSNNPTPGAYEDKDYDYDLVLLDILNPTHLCPTNFDVQVRVINWGNVDATSYQVAWQVNGVPQAPLTVNQPLLAGDTSAFLHLGSVSFIQGNIYNVSAQVMLGGNLDENIWNDTLAHEFHIKALSGSYTVGGTQPDYPLLVDALKDAKKHGLCGDVTFEMRTGNYQYSVAEGPLFFTDIPVSSTADKLIITSEGRDSSLVSFTISGNIGVKPFAFLGNNHIKLQDLTFRSIINIISAGGTLEIDRCKINAAIENDYSLSGTELHNLIIRNSNLYSPVEVNVLDTLMIENVTSQSTGRVISESRHFYLKHSSFYNANAKLQVVTSGNAEIVYNKLLSSSITYTNQGFISDSARIYNNYFKGFSYFQSGTSYLGVHFNTFYDKTSNKPLLLVADNFTMRNNVVVNDTTVGLVFDLAYQGFTNQPLISGVIDNNVYYTASNPAFRFNQRNFATFQSFIDTVHQDANSYFLMPDFVNPAIGPEINNDPNLAAKGAPVSWVTDDFEGDLRNMLMPDIGADEFSVPVVYADAELVSITLDDMPCASGNIYATLSNAGNVVLNSVSVEWDVNGLASNYLWQGALATGATVDSIIIGTFTFVPGNSYAIAAHTTNPNGQLDIDTSNDSAAATLTLPVYTLFASSDSTVCLGDSVLLTVSTAGYFGFTSQWSNGATSDSLVISGSQTVSVIVADTFACEHLDTFQLMEYAAIVLTTGTVISDTCGLGVGELEVIVAGGQSPYSYLWSNGQTTAVCSGLVAGNYSVTVTDLAGCSNIDTFTLNAVCDNVWPGDANLDGVANNYDVLNLGLAFGEVGPLRPAASILWVGQPMQDWGSATNSIDNKHADCNGDGVVSHDDTLAVQSNYGLIHNKRDLARSSDPEITVSFDTDTLRIGDTTMMNILLGNVNNPVAAIHGLAYTVTYNSSLCNIHWGSTDWTNSFMLQQTVPISLVHARAGVTDMAISRIDQQDANGYGIIARVPVSIQPGALLQNQVLTDVVEISNVYGVNSGASEVTFSVGQSSPLVLTSIVSSIGEIEAERFELYPNPAASQVRFDTSIGMADELVVIDISGKIVLSQMSFDMTKALDISTLPSGSYFVKVVTDKQSIVKRLTVSK